MTTDVLVVQPIDATGVAALRDAGLTVHVAADTRLDTLRPHLATARAVIVRNEGLSGEAIALAPCLRVIVAHGTGTDRVDRAAAAARGIAVRNTPGANARSVAEHALALILACAKRIPDGDRAVRTGDFALRDRVRATELSGLTLGLVGFGRIARLVAGYGHALGMRVCAVSAAAPYAEMTAAGVEPLPDPDALCVRSDVVSLHTVPRPGGPLFDAARFARMRRGAVLVNTARGALVDEAALAAALRSGHLSAAAVDVFAIEPPATDGPLFAAPNLILSPHLGGSTAAALVRTARAAADAVIEALRG